MKTLIRIVFLTIGLFAFSSQSSAQEVRLGFGFGAGFNFLPNATGFDAAFGFQLPSINLEVQALYQIEKVRRTFRLKGVSKNTVFDRYGAIRVFCGLHSI